jgi:hypothetical protein
VACNSQIRKPVNGELYQYEGPYLELDPFPKSDFKIYPKLLKYWYIIRVCENKITSILLSTYGSTAICWALAAFSVS